MTAPGRPTSGADALLPDELRPLRPPGTVYRPAPTPATPGRLPARTRSGAAVLVLNPHGYYDGRFNKRSAPRGPAGQRGGRDPLRAARDSAGPQRVLGWASPRITLISPTSTPRARGRHPVSARRRTGCSPDHARTPAHRAATGGKPGLFRQHTGRVRQRSVPFRLTPADRGGRDRHGTVFVHGGRLCRFRDFDQMMAMAARATSASFAMPWRCGNCPVSM